MFADDIVAGRGFIAVALVYFGRWDPWWILGGSLLFSIAQSLQLSIQVLGISFPYEFAVMLPYVLVILVLSFTRGSSTRGPAELGVPTTGRSAFSAAFRVCRSQFYCRPRGIRASTRISSSSLPVFIILAIFKLFKER